MTKQRCCRRRARTSAAIILLTLTLSACATGASQREGRILVGTASGAAVGGALGAAGGGFVPGAIVGGVVGAISGFVYDDYERRQAEESVTPPPAS
ncbi:MAG: glycine zipper domain-containing protein [Pseudomonadota bacterium]